MKGIEPAVVEVATLAGTPDLDHGASLAPARRLVVITDDFLGQKIQGFSVLRSPFSVLRSPFSVLRSPFSVETQNKIRHVVDISSGDLCFGARMEPGVTNV